MGRGEPSKNLAANVFASYLKTFDLTIFFRTSSLTPSPPPPPPPPRNCPSREVEHGWETCMLIHRFASASVKKVILKLHTCYRLTGYSSHIRWCWNNHIPASIPCILCLFLRYILSSPQTRVDIHCIERSACRSNTCFAFFCSHQLSPSKIKTKL